MNLSRRLMLFIAFLNFGHHAIAQCPMGTVKVNGRVDGLVGDAVSAEVSVTLEMPKGQKSKTGPITNGEFSLDVPFGTQSAPWFPLWGHRCNRVPRSIVVKATVGNRVVGHRRLVFKDDFQPESPYIYRLDRELTIKASRQVE
jgi:hypothetical protein